MELKGTKTEKNLWEAFAGESQARNKYTYFASMAKKEGYEQLAAIFEETAGNEKEHAKIWFKLLCGGAEEVMFPEEKENINSDRVIQQILENRSIGKRHNLVVVAEGVGGTQKLAQDIQEITGIQTRATILGHLQRGGSPTATDRMHASMMGYHAVKAILEGRKNIAVAYNRGRYEILDLLASLQMDKELDPEIYDVIKILSI